VTRTTATFEQIEKFVFVVTYGRSGSTLIQRMLNTLPGACVRGENGNALRPLAMSWHAVHAAPVLRRLSKRDTPTPVTSPWYGGETIDSQHYGRALAKLFTHEILTPPPNTRISGFKEIRWTHEPTGFAKTLNFARLCFPNAFFIFNTRDHAQVARSGWWAERPEDKVRERLTRADTLFESYLAQHPACGVRVHYNDYLQDHDALRPIFSLLDEPFDPQAISSVMSEKLTHLQKET